MKLSRCARLRAAWCCLFSAPLDYRVALRVREGQHLVGSGTIHISIPASCRRMDITSCTYSGFSGSLWVEASVRSDG